MRCTTCGRACFVGRRLVKLSYNRNSDADPATARRAMRAPAPHTARDLATRTTTNRIMGVRDSATGVRAQYHHQGAQPPSQPLTPSHDAHACAQSCRPTSSAHNGNYIDFATAHDPQVFINTIYPSKVSQTHTRVLCSAVGRRKTGPGRGPRPQP